MLIITLVAFQRERKTDMAQRRLPSRNFDDDDDDNSAEEGPTVRRKRVSEVRKINPKEQPIDVLD